MRPDPHTRPHTPQPPTCSASTVASTSRLGDSVGFTPLAAMMSATLVATRGFGVNLAGGQAGGQVG